MQETYFYFIVTISLIYLLYKFRTEKMAWFIILIYYNGLFSFFGANIWNFYKIILFIISFFMLFGNRLYRQFEISKVKTAFNVFSIFFILLSIINGDYFFIIFSQYAKYFVLFFIFLFLYKNKNKPEFKKLLEQVVSNLLIVQIILTMCKFATIGITESVVGSISWQGGATATTLPLLGFIFIWLKNGGQLKRNDWFIIAGLMSIGYVSLKRAIWFFAPIVIILFLIYVPGRKISFRSIILGILAFPLVFYLGVRLNPTLNRDGIIWGSFDIEYSIEYAQMYMYGKDVENKDSKILYGRGNATIGILNNLIDGTVKQEDWLGYGLIPMYTTDYEQFGEFGFGLNHKGSATGMFQTKITHGYLGIIILLLFVGALVYKIKHARIRNAIIVFFIWEYFFYTGSILRETSLAFLFVYIIVFADQYAIEIRQKNNKLIISNETKTEFPN